MSELIAEAQVAIVPNVEGFAVTLRKQLEAAVIAAGPVVVPITAAPISGAAASTAAFVTAQGNATAATLGLSEATGLETQALDLSAKAQLDAAKAAQIAGAAATEEATQLARLAVAQDAAVIAFKKSEAVTVAAVGATSELAGARSVLVAATRSLIANEVAFDAALATNSDALKADAAAALVDARAIQVDAQAAFDAALAHRNLAKAELESAASARATAGAHAQATRGVTATTAGMVGLRGATLAASNPFIIGAAAAIVFSKAIKESRDETEEFNKTAVVFGSSAKEVEDFSKTTARSLGISRVEALRAAGVFGNLFRTIKISEPVAASMSIRLVKLASDLASFNNADPSRTLDALRSGLVGQARPLRVFGIFLSAARVQQEALIETGKKQAKQLTDAEKVQARFNIILADSGISQGDFSNTSERLANQTRILTAQLSDLGAELGTVLLPVITGTIKAFNDLFSDIQDGIDQTRRLAGEIGNLAAEIEKSSPARFVIEIIEKVPGGGELGDAFKKLKAEAEIAAGSALFAGGGAFSELGIGIPVAAAGIILLNKGLHDFNAEAKEAGTNAKQSVQDLFDQFKKAGEGKEAFQSLLTGLTALEAKLATGDAFSQAFARGILRLIIQLRGLGDNPKIEDIGKAIADAIARGFNTRAFVIGDAVKKAITFNASQITGQLQAQVTAVARAQAFGGSGLAELGKELTRIDRILASKKAPVGPALEQLLNERKSVIGQIKSINEGAAADVLERATKAAKRQSDAIQAFIETFTPKRQRLQNRLSQAAQSGTAKTQIAINKLIIAQDKEEIEAIRSRIRHLKLHGDALKLARAAINTLQQEIFKTRLDIEKDRKNQQDAAKQAAQDRLDARQTHLEAILSIAETTEGTRDDRKALNALIRFDEARIAALKKIRHKTQEEKAQLDAYRVDLAQRKKALDDLNKQTKDTQKSQASLFFTFLQTQQGFAANLLGNLIPGFATGGLVGGSQAAAAGPGAGAGFQQTHLAPEDRVGAQAAVASSRDRGVRPVQVDTTNQLLRQILRSLQNLNGRTQHPEARHNRAVGSAVLDTMGGVHGA